MSSVRVKRRVLREACPTCGKTTHLQVVFRVGGRGFPEVAAGTFHYERDAKARRDLVSGELAAGRDPRATIAAVAAETARPRTLRDVAAAYLASRIDHHPATSKGVRSHLARLERELGSSLDPASLTVTGCIDLVGRLAADLSPSTVVHYVGTLRLLLDYAGVDPNPARDGRVRLPSVRRLEPNPPTAAHVVAILERVPSRWVLPLVTIEQTGMAIGETARLEWGDVDVAGCRFRLRRSTVKGQLAARARWVQVPGWLMRLIDASCPVEDRAPGRRVFAGVNAAAAQDAMRRACRTAGIPHYHPHDLRHRRLSLWHGQGIPARELAARAGHAKASMTLDVYSHVMPLDEVDAGALAELAKAKR